MDANSPDSLPPTDANSPGSPNLSDAVMLLISRVDGFGARLERVEINTAHTNASIADILTGIVNLQTSSSDVRVDIVNTRVDLADTRVDLAVVQNDIVDLGTRLTGVENGIEGLGVAHDQTVIDLIERLGGMDRTMVDNSDRQAGTSEAFRMINPNRYAASPGALASEYREIRLEMDLFRSEMRGEILNITSK